MFTHTEIESGRDSRCNHRKIQSEHLALRGSLIEELIDWDMIEIV